MSEAQESKWQEFRVKKKENQDEHVETKGSRFSEMWSHRSLEYWEY